MAIAEFLLQNRALTVRFATSRQNTRLPISCRKPIIFDDTYLDIIAVAEVNVASGKENSRKKKYLDELKKTVRANHPGFCIRKLGWLLLKRENKR